jgi:hypothetical protein
VAYTNRPVTIETPGLYLVSVSDPVDPDTSGTATLTTALMVNGVRGSRACDILSSGPQLVDEQVTVVLDLSAGDTLAIQYEFGAECWTGRGRVRSRLQR